MNASPKYPMVCAAALLVSNCRKAETGQAPATVPPQTAGESSGPALSGMSRKERQAHRILETVAHLERALAVLATMDGKGRLAWTEGSQPDLAAASSALLRIREETAATAADETQPYHGKMQSQLEAAFKQMVEFGNQAILPEGSAESRDFAAALIGASDAMETTNAPSEIRLKS